MRHTGTIMAILIAFTSSTLTPATMAEELRMVALGFSGRLTEPITQTALHGAELAIADANDLAARKHLPLRFKLLPQDDHGNENFAINIAHYYAKEKVAGVIGPWSSDAAVASADIYERAQIPQIGFTATNSRWTNSGNKMPFRVVGGTSDVAPVLAEAAVSSLHGKRILLIQNDSSYSMALADAFVDWIVKGRRASVERYQATRRTTDFSAALKVAAQSEVDVIVFIALYPQQRAFLDAARRARTGARILISGSASNLSSDLDDDGRLYVLEYEVPQPHCPRWQTLSATYLRQFRSAPSSYTYHAYDAASVLTSAILQVGPDDGARIARAIHQGQHAGLHGPIHFNDRGANAQPRFTLYQFQGQWRAVQYFPEGAGKREKCL